MILLIMCRFYLKEKLIKFILATQDDETGGFADRPGDMVSWSLIHYQDLLYRNSVKHCKNNFPKRVLHFECNELVCKASISFLNFRLILFIRYLALPGSL